MNVVLVLEILKNLYGQFKYPKIVKKYDVIIQAGGRGSRLRHYTWNKPKCLVSYEGKPVIYHIFKILKNSNFHIIADYKINLIKKYFKINPPTTNFRIYETKHKGTCAGINRVLKNIDNNKELLIIWSDLILDKMPLFKKSPTVVTTSSFTCRWSVKSKKIIEVPSFKDGIPGIFYFKNKKLLKKIPVSGEFVRWCSENFKYFNTLRLNSIKELGDFSTIESSYNKIGFGRFFNKIEIKKNFVYKSSLDKNFNHLIKKEQTGIQKLKSLALKIYLEYTLKILTKWRKLMELIFLTLKTYHQINLIKF
jgi:GTP:adenosylcobinamide-phosphate guanylyltransferase